MERPILFNTEMVKAILEGRKTQTRRIIKNKYDNADITFFENKYGKRLVYRQNDADEPVKLEDGSTRRKLVAMEEIKKPCEVGDILWVRETWSSQYDGIHDDNGYGKYVYKADDIKLDNSEGISSSRWYPSIHMPKEAARIFLKVTGVRAERLQEITEEEARSEGIQWSTKDGNVFKYFTSLDAWMEYHTKNKKRYHGTAWQDMPKTAKQAFEILWDSCYQWPKCWLYNPWVWVIEFEIKEIK